MKKAFRVLRAGLLILLGLATQMFAVYLVFNVFEEHWGIALFVWILISLAGLGFAFHLRRTKKPVRWYFYSTFVMLFLAPVIMFFMAAHPSDQWVEDEERVEQLDEEWQKQGFSDEERFELRQKEREKIQAEREAEYQRNRERNSHKE